MNDSINHLTEQPAKVVLQPICDTARNQALFTLARLYPCLPFAAACWKVELSLSLSKSTPRCQSPTFKLTHLLARSRCKITHQSKEGNPQKQYFQPGLAKPPGRPFLRPYHGLGLDLTTALVYPQRGWNPASQNHAKALELDCLRILTGNPLENTFRNAKADTPGCLMISFREDSAGI